MTEAFFVPGLFDPAQTILDPQNRLPSWMEILSWSAGACLIVAAWSFGLRTLELGISPHAVHAATVTGYDASLILVSAPTILAPGQTSQVTVTAKNIGVFPWQQKGAKALSIYHWDPKRKVETPSAFAVATWPARDRPALLSDKVVGLGDVTNFVFPIRAPVKPGRYHGDFILTVENTARIKTGAFSFDIEVTNAKSQTIVSMSPTITPPSTPPAPIAPSLSTGKADWSAELVDKGGSEWQINADDHVVVTVAFKNIGNKTWTRDTADYVSLYATDESGKERPSSFKDSTWLSVSHPAKLKESEVKPSQIGHFSIDLRAPEAPAAYQETFALAAEKKAWLMGGAVVLPIRVPFTSEFVATAPPDQSLITSVSDVPKKSLTPGAYQTVLLLRSSQEIAGPGSVPKSLTLGFKNTGTNPWISQSLRIKGVQPVLPGSLSSVQDESWANAFEPVKLNNQIKPGEIAFLNFKLKTPVKRGTYQASFVLQADGTLVDGGAVDIPITVTADGVIVSAPSSVNNNQPSYNAIPLTGDTSSLPTEPMIRVGLYKTTDDGMVVTAKFAPLTISLNGSAVCHLSMSQFATVQYDRANRVYKLSGNVCAGQSAGVYIIRADDGLSPMEISDYSRPVGWLPGANDNTFRIQLELRYAPSTDSVWVINELPIEWYLKGIGETSNSSPQEYQRALLTAARTYAMYHVQRQTKHANESYTVDAHYDQVYRGYGAEARDPNVVAAVDVTRGQIVTYNAQLALTPYYSRSDGRTRAWTEVWGGGPYPWLVSVPVPWDQGKTLWGHGVGLSASGALGAANDGWTYDRILKYFYPGIELRRAYK